MRVASTALLLLFVVALVASATVASAADSRQPGHNWERYIIKFHQRDTPWPTANALQSRFSGVIHHVFERAGRGAAISVPPGLKALLERDPRVAAIEPDLVLHATVQTLATGSDRVDAELSEIADIDGVDIRVDADIAILDTGVDLDHPDLNVYRHAQCVNVSPCVENDPGADDVYGHGTHVAGIAAALDNNTATVGAAPGARIWNVKVLGDNGSGLTSDIIAGVEYVMAHADEIEVANMSLGGQGSSAFLSNAIRNASNAGVLFVLSAGNSGMDVNNYTPAGQPDSITVSALADADGQPGGLATLSYKYGGSAACTENQDDSFACFSNYGKSSNDRVDMIAPGVAIKSTKIGGGTTKKHGTSQAAPLVAGAALLYRTRFPGYSPGQIKTEMIASGDSAPCAAGSCTDDPDGVQEPMLYIGCTDSDSDTDFFCDYLDNCPLDSNPDQLNNDGDSQGDACDPDDDNDGLTDLDEAVYGSNPFIADSDGDRLTDAEEVNIHASDPVLPDTDNDGISDGDEVIVYGMNPVQSNRGDLTPRGAPDNVLNAGDILVLSGIVLGTIQPDALQSVLADVDGNGLINAGDTLLLQRRLLGSAP